MSIWRGVGGGGDATTDSEINLITSLANSITDSVALVDADAAAAAASASAAATSASNALTSENDAATSATNASTSASNALGYSNAASVSAAAALVSQNAAAASAASVNDTNLVHITGTETITGTKTFSTSISGSITGNAATVTNGVYTSGDQTIAGIKTFSSTIVGSVNGNAATATTASSVTNGVYTTGDQTIAGVKTFSNDIIVPSVNGGQLAGLRNKIINGNMGIAQRGTAAVTASGNYGPADRWQTAATGDTFSTTQGSFVSGDTLYDTGGAQYFTQIAVTSVAAAGNYTTYFQYIEDVRLLAGQTVTVSFWAKAASGTPSIGLEIVQNFGTGGSPSSAVTGVGQAQALTTTLTKYSKTFTIPSINGKTVGTTANTSSTTLNFWLDAGSTYATRSGSIGQASKTVSIAQVQLEIGSVATPFEQRPIGMELALCQRYYTQLGGNSANDLIIQAYAGSAGIANSLSLTLPVAMRTAPTLTKVGTWGVSNCSQPAAVASSVNTVAINATAVVAGNMQANTLNTTTYLTALAEL